MLVEQDELYTCATSSDYGSTLLTDDRFEIDNHGRHSTFEKARSVILLKGFHKIRIQYFQIDGGELKGYISPLKRAKAELTPSVLFN